LSASLAARFGHVVAFDNLHPQVHVHRTRPAALHPNVELVSGDVTDGTSWAALLTSMRPDVVIHLAAETGTGQSLTNVAQHAGVNVTGTAVMLDALAQAGAMPRRLVLASSRSVYGEGGWWSRRDKIVHYPGQRTREQLSDGVWDFPALEYRPVSAARTRPAPVSVYGATKLAQEHIMSSWATAFSVDLVILRLQNVYGPGQSLVNPYTGIVPLFCRLARQGASIPLYEDGAMLRDFVLIDDVAAAILRAVDIDCPPQRPLDVGTGRRTSIADLARQIAALYGAPEPHVCGKYRHGDVRHAVCQLGDTLAQLDWAPRHGLDTGLPALFNWIESEKVQDVP
jgi:dTDP-L-rhamnose 4-epimerase